MIELATIYPVRRSRPYALSPSVSVFLILITLARVFAASTIPLTEDEAYYRLWSQHLAFGYFDHPPMVAWWIAVGRTIGGDTALGARLLSILSTTAVSLLIIDIGRSLGLSDRASERAALWYNAMFLIALGGAIITPDVPATCFWSITLWALSRGWRSRAGSWWLAAGAAAGFAMLSKYSAIFIAPGVLLWLLRSPDGRSELRQPWPWIALLLAIAIFSPNLIWNATHQWLSISKQLSRVEPQSFTPQHVIDFPATQFFLLNPLIAVFAAVGVFEGLKTGSSNSTFLPLTIAPFAVYLFLHSLHSGVQAHWPAPLYPAAAVLAARAAQTRTTTGWSRAATIVPWLGLTISGLILLHMALPQTDWLGKADPVGPLRGWSSFAKAVEQKRLAQGADWVGTFSYGGAAELLNERQSTAPIIELIERGRYAFQGDAPSPKGPGVVIELKRRITDVDLTPCFGRVQRLPDLFRGDPGARSVRYVVYRVADPKVNITERGCRIGKDRSLP